jgi:D-sedoheptulose 7-phosphate isomerase
MSDGRASAGATALADHLELAGRVEALLPQADEVARRLIETYERGGRVYTFGNGGSSVDAQHFAEELVGRFQRERRPLAAQSLAADAAVLTCIANDYSFEEVFERQVRGFVRAEDMVIAFSTSGRSPNVVRGLAAAREVGATTVLFGGGRGGEALEHAELALLIPSETTARVQELHVFFLHVVLDRVDAWAAGAA